MTDESALWETDALLDALAAGEPLEQDYAVSLLAALVADVSADLPDAPPLPDEVRARRSRLLPRTGVAAAGVLVLLSTGGVAAASVNAGPTSALFPLHQVLTGQPQLDGSQRQALEVRDKLQSATRALAAGKVERAQRDVTAAAGRIAKVAEVDGRRDLAAEWVMVNKQVKARVATPVLPARPTQTATPAPVSPTPTPVAPTHHPKPTVSPTPDLPPTTTPAPVTSTTAPPTSVVPVAPTTTPAAPTSPQPSDTTTVAPQPSDPAPSAPDTPDPSDTSGKGHHGKGGKGSPTTPPTAAPGSPVDPIVITPSPDPSVTLSQQPGNQTAPAPSSAPSDPGVPSAQDGSVPTSSDSPPASSTPSANPLA